MMILFCLGNKLVRNLTILWAKRQAKPTFVRCGVRPSIRNLIGLIYLRPKPMIALSSALDMTWQ